MLELCRVCALSASALGSIALGLLTVVAFDVTLAQPATAQETAQLAVAVELTSGPAETLEFPGEAPGDPLLLLTPAGPFVVQTLVTIDGRSERSHQERQMQALLEQFDTNRDGRATWDEAVLEPGFGFGAFRALQESARNEQLRPRIINYLRKTYDRNHNELVDAGELLALRTLAQPPSTSQFAPQSEFKISGSQIRDWLDVDRDGTLSARELAAAGERLRLRDADGNDLLTAPELQNVELVAGPGAGAGAMLGPPRALSPSGIPLTKDITPENAERILRLYYKLGETDAWPVWPLRRVWWSQFDRNFVQSVHQRNFSDAQSYRYRLQLRYRERDREQLR